MTSKKPGRNEPCPCGSGGKYKTCCMAGDREKRQAGPWALSTVPGHGPEGDPSAVWQVELVPHPAFVETEPDARLAVAFVVGPETPLHAEVHSSPSGEAGVVAGLLADAVLAAGRKVGGLPQRVEARHPEVVTALAERLAGRGVQVVARPRLPRLDAHSGAMVAGDTDEGSVGSYPRPCFSFARTWRAWALPDKAVRALFAAGAELFRSEAWEMLGDDARLEIETAEGRVWAVSVLGGAGIETGVAIYSDPADRERILSEPSVSDPDALNGRCLCFTFDPVDEIPPPMRREVLLSGWEVAAPDAYPTVHTINTPGGGISRTDARDLAVTLRGVAAGCDRLGGAYFAGRNAEWTHAATGAVLRLTGEPWRAPSRTPAPGTVPGTPAPTSIHRLHVSLDEIEPPIWRRVEVPSDLSLHGLHRVLQDTMGWADYHLYLFEVDGVRYGEPDEEGWTDFADSAGISLAEVAGQPGKRFRYVYDFGDDWGHTLVVEAVEEPEADTRYLRCLDGARACPVEDSGGPFGHAELVEALRNPDAEGARELIEWAGADYDPEEFDIELVNDLLAGALPPGVLDPERALRFDKVADLLEAVGIDDDLPIILVNAATALLYDYALLDPESFLGVRKGEILAGAGLHAAGMLLPMPWMGWRPTLDELAELLDVSTASIGGHSRKLRELVSAASRLDSDRF